MQAKHGHTVIKLSIENVKTPKHVITHTSTEKMNDLMQEAKNNGGMVQEPVSVVLENGNYIAIERISSLHAALKGRQKKILAVIMESKYDAQTMHLKFTKYDVVNPVAKVIAIRYMLDSTDLNADFSRVTHGDKYYNALVAMEYSSEVEKELEKLMNKAIELAINMPPPIKFFKDISRLEIEDQLNVLRNTETLFEVAWAPNFVWTVETSRMLTEAGNTKEKTPGKKIASMQVMSIDGQDYSVSMKDEKYKIEPVEITKIEGQDDTLFVSTGEVDVHDIPIITPENIKFLGNPKKIQIAEFSSPEKLYKKLSGINRPILVVMGTDDGDEQ